VTAADLEAFHRRMGWNRTRLARELDISDKRVRRLLDGRQPIPRYIALACTAMALGAPPMGTQMEELT
jgi:plasmid maintenance system antidote protein VapI